MSEVLKREQWPIYLDYFNELNEGRLTQIKIFDFINVERHLPFRGICLDEMGKDSPRIEIMLGGDAADDGPHFTHTITHVVRITRKTAAGGIDEGMEILNADGVRTALHLEQAHTTVDNRQVARSEI
jgi:hypothetical protein